ncbi:COP9 signalosome complex subunit 7a-like [Biomphalaria glabrata]|uniref:COP9 signalosome complex subunit 7a-like n=1 Tax=Biomphalaria glabrata TaxID=6526 RepID=A0A9W2YPY9_BIOGL|nr:COP9 signalosome complex subunit 7a-like [Biomphalaria glabrata]XP_055864776.1 COP9 signalosome complex subunit 7a-like [Biomphalaria glabrata]
MSSAEKTANPLEPFLLLLKDAKQAGAASIVTQAMGAPNVFVFGEILHLPNVQELANGPHAAVFQLLNVFAYGTYKDYKASTAQLPDLTAAQLTKLRHLTVVSLATKTKCIPYSVLLDELAIDNVRNLEDLIIEVIYADIIHGKLDQKNQQLEVDYAIGRDIHDNALTEVVNVLQQWCNGCEGVLKSIEEQIIRANTFKEKQNQQQAALEDEVLNIKKTIKTTQQQDLDEAMVTDSRSDLTADKSSKKTTKTKGLRGSNPGKLWK